MKTETEKLTRAIRDEIALLRRWADESERGGWSTHQVGPMRERANALALLLCGIAPPTPTDPERR